MKLTKSERFIIANQYKIMAQLESIQLALINKEIIEDENPITRKLIKQSEAYMKGYSTLYSDFNLIDDDLSQIIQDETFEILNMYTRLNSSIENLPSDEKSMLKFNGFDSNNEHYRFAMFIKNNYSWLDDLDSKNDLHVLDKYKRMLEIFNKNQNIDTILNEIITDLKK